MLLWTIQSYKRELLFAQWRWFTELNWNNLPLFQTESIKNTDSQSLGCLQ